VRFKQYVSSFHKKKHILLLAKTDLPTA